MTTQEQLFAEVTNTFKSYDEAGLIDEISMRQWLKSELKRFGNNIMVPTDGIVEIKNGKGKLPDSFWTLREAWLYTPNNYLLNRGSEKELEKSGVWRTRVVQGGSCNRCEEVPSDTFIIKEEFHFKDSSATIFGTPSPLKLKKGFNRAAVAQGCVNISRNIQGLDVNEINILGNYLQADFNNGFIYIKYMALPTDENGDFAIPETQHDRLRIYLEYYLKRRIAEDLLLNNDDPNMINKLQYLRQNEIENFGLAMTEAKALVLDPSTWKTLRNMNRRRHLKYEATVPNLHFN